MRAEKPIVAERSQVAAETQAAGAQPVRKRNPRDESAANAQGETQTRPAQPEPERNPPPSSAARAGKKTKRRERNRAKDRAKRFAGGH